jgi:hypothetical protein
VQALAQIRHVGGWGNEGKSRKRGENETEEEAKKLDQAYIAYERAKRFEERFIALEKWALLAEVHFGDAVATDMRSLIGSRNRVVNASFEIYGLEKNYRPNDSTWKMLNKLHALVTASEITDAEEPTMNDVLTGEIEATKARVVATLRPYLAEPRLNTLLRPTNRLDGA